MKNTSAKLKLLQYFCFTGLIAVVFTVALSIFYQYQSRKELIILSEENNIALARSFSNSLRREFSFLTDSDSFEAAELSDRPQIGLIQKVVRKQMQGLSVAKVKIYNSRKTIFSTDEIQIGQDKSKSK